MNFKPLGNRVIIELDEIPAERMSASGIILPDFNDVKKQNTQTGKVVAVGPGVKNKEGKYVPSILKKDDWVVINHHALFKCEVISGDNAETFLYLSENDIVAIIE